MYIKRNFGPVAIQGATVPRVFGYINLEEKMDDMKTPGYFDDQKVMLRPNSRIDVVAKDCVGSLFVAGIFDNKLCVYQNDIRIKRGGVILPEKTESPKEEPTKAA